MERPSYGAAARLLFAVPVLGWMLREIAEGRDGALGWFAVFVISALGVAVLTAGLPGLVLGMLGVAALSLATILLVTRG